MLKSLSALAGIVAGLGVAGLQAAEAVELPSTNHLQCYDAKEDAQTNSVLRAVRFQLSGSDFVPEACKLLELKRFCTPVAKQLLEPEVPIDDFDGPAAAGSYACYRARCDQKEGPGELQIRDQFGDRAVRLGRTVEMCAPVAGDLVLAASWTDFENQSDELPAAPFGDCATQGKDRVGIEVLFDDGTAASAVYSGVSALWNTTFAGLAPESATGFLASCTGLHFLFANGSNLPMAWESCVMSFASNFDLDYIEANGSHFRAEETGWVSAQFTTYCGD